MSTQYQDIQSLLNEVNIIRHRNEEKARANGSLFNIFTIANISTDETKVCRVIKELIDPNSTHGQGAIFLQLFLKHVLHIHDIFTDLDYQQASVEREKHIENDRRIDIYIRIKDKLIPIEVKIYAADQYAQCSDYFKYAQNSSLYYLTLDGHKPSKDSLKDLDISNIHTISFSNEIICWLYECLKLPSVIRISPIREILIQFIDTLKYITGQTEETMEKEIQNVILKSKDNFKNAILISKAVSEASEDIKDKLFSTLDERISQKYNVHRLVNKNDFTKLRGQEYPGISYKIGAASNHADFCIRLEIDKRYHTMFSGICTMNQNGSCEIKSSTTFTPDSILSGKWKQGTYWLAWRYVYDDTSLLPDFKYHNDAFYDLLNEECFNHYVDDCMMLFEEIVNSLLSPFSLKNN